MVGTSQDFIWSSTINLDLDHVQTYVDFTQGIKYRIFLHPYPQQPPF